MYMEIDPNAVVGLFLLASVILMALREIKAFNQQAARHQQHLRLIEELDQSIRMDSTNAMAIWRKGEIYEAMGRTLQAVRSYRTAHMVCPAAYTSGDYTEAFVRVAKSRPPLLGFRLHELQSGSR